MLEILKHLKKAKLFVLVGACNSCGETLRLSSNSSKKPIYCERCKADGRMKPEELEFFKTSFGSSAIKLLVKNCKGCGNPMILRNPKLFLREYCREGRDCKPSVHNSRLRLARIRKEQSGKCPVCGKQFSYITRGRLKRTTCGARSCWTKLLSSRKEISASLPRPWSKEEKERLKTAYQNFSVSELADRFQRSVYSIKKMARKLGLSRKPESRCYTTIEVGQKLGVSKTMIYKWIKRGELKARRNSKRYLIPEVELLAFAKFSNLALPSLNWASLGPGFERKGSELFRCRKCKKEIRQIPERNLKNTPLFPYCRGFLALERRIESEKAKEIEKKTHNRTCPGCLSEFTLVRRDPLRLFCSSCKQRAKSAVFLSSLEGRNCRYCGLYFLPARSAFCSLDCERAFQQADRKQAKTNSRLLTILRLLYKESDSDLDIAFLKLKQIWKKVKEISS